MLDGAEKSESNGQTQLEAAARKILLVNDLFWQKKSRSMLWQPQKRKDCSSCVTWMWASVMKTDRNDQVWCLWRDGNIWLPIKKRGLQYLDDVKICRLYWVLVRLLPQKHWSFFFWNKQTKTTCTLKDQYLFRWQELRFHFSLKLF